MVLGVLQALQAPQPQRRESTRIPVSGRQQALVRVLRRRALLIRRHQASVARQRASASPLRSSTEGRASGLLTPRRGQAPLPRLTAARALFVLAHRLRALRLRLVEHLGTVREGEMLPAKRRRPRTRKPMRRFALKMRRACPETLAAPLTAERVKVAEGLPSTRRSRRRRCMPNAILTIMLTNAAFRQASRGLQMRTRQRFGSWRGWPVSMQPRRCWRETRRLRRPSCLLK